MRIALSLLAAVTMALIAENAILRHNLRSRQKVIEAFLERKQGGTKLRDLVREDSLAVFPGKDGEALACGVVRLTAAPASPQRSQP